MLSRSFRALLLFATVFVSYAVQWCLWRATWRRCFQTRWQRVHRKNAERLARGFVRLRGVYIKLGQVISVMGTFLPGAYGDALRRLQDTVPPRPFQELQRRFHAAWGPEGLAQFSEFSEQALAAASLAQVHRARTKDGRDVAIKVLYPDIEQVVERDLQVVRWLMPVIHRVFGFRSSGAVVEQLERMLHHELDYQHERENIARFQQLFAQRKDVIVPQVLDSLSSKAVLVMSFEAGISLSDPEALRQAGLDPVALARTLVDCYMSMLFEHRLFHADPHPGNFLARGENQLVVLDYGAVEPVSEELVQGIRTVVMGGLTRNPDLVLQGIERMGFVAEGGDKALLERVGREYLRTLGQLTVKDFAHIDSETLLKLSGAAQLRGQLRQVTGSLRYPDSYFYVERALALLFGLVGKLAPEKGLLGIAAPLAAKALSKMKPTAGNG